MVFNVHPWQMLRLQPLRRAWYEEVTQRHREREHEHWQALLDALAHMLGAK